MVRAKASATSVANRCCAARATTLKSTATAAPSSLDVQSRSPPAADPDLAGCRLRNSKRSRSPDAETETSKLAPGATFQPKHYLSVGLLRNHAHDHPAHRGTPDWSTTMLGNDAARSSARHPRASEDRGAEKVQPPLRFRRRSNTLRRARPARQTPDAPARIGRWRQDLRSSGGWRQHPAAAELDARSPTASPRTFMLATANLTGPNPPPCTHPQILRRDDVDA